MTRRSTDPARNPEISGWSPVWSKDGRELFYRSGDKFLAASVRNDGERPHFETPVELFEGAYGSSSPIRNYDVSPDGRFLMHTLPEGEVLTAAVESVFPDRVQVVLGWFGELRP